MNTLLAKGNAIIHVFHFCKVTTICSLGQSLKVVILSDGVVFLCFLGSP